MDLLYKLNRTVNTKKQKRLGIFDFFKTSDTNKCKVCGDIIQSEFEICYSCKEKKKEIFENNLISPQDIEFLDRKFIAMAEMFIKEPSKDMLGKLIDVLESSGRNKKSREAFIPCNMKEHTTAGIAFIELLSEYQNGEINKVQLIKKTQQNTMNLVLEVQGRLNTNLRVNAYDISRVDGNKGFYKGKLFTGIGFTLNEEGNVDYEVEFDDNGSMIETRMFHKNGQISSIIISNNDKWGGVINVEIKKFDEFGNLITN